MGKKEFKLNTALHVPPEPQTRTTTTKRTISSFSTDCIDEVDDVDAAGGKK
jgi:hypothetical protein